MREGGVERRGKGKKNELEQPPNRAVALFDMVCLFNRRSTLPTKLEIAIWYEFVAQLVFATSFFFFFFTVLSNLTRFSP